MFLAPDPAYQIATTVCLKFRQEQLIREEQPAEAQVRWFPARVLTLRAL
jgi:hypothetical protein